MVPDQTAAASLADRLDRLFRTVHPASRGEYTHEEVARAIRDRGVSISHTYIWQLRRGVRDNPTKRHLEALAQFFGVPITYFFDHDTSAVDTQLELLVALRDQSVRAVALRSAGLSPAALKAIMGVIEHTRAVEGLPPLEEGK